MLIFSDLKLAFLAVPKTGTTAVEMALKPRADIVFSKQRKHMNAQRFHTRIAPFLLQTFDLIPERVAVMRDPIEQMRALYDHLDLGEFDQAQVLVNEYDARMWNPGVEFLAFNIKVARIGCVNTGEHLD